MQDYVTFETALKLKKAGFPQPEIRFSQMFYVEFRYTEEIGRHVYTTGVWDSDNPCLATNPIFAPRVTDIMPYLPSATFWLSETSGAFVIDCPVGNAREMEYHTNPAEAAAQMWLKLNQK